MAGGLDNEIHLLPRLRRVALVVCALLGADAVLDGEDDPELSMLLTQTCLRAVQVHREIRAKLNPPKTPSEPPGPGLGEGPHAAPGGEPNLAWTCTGTDREETKA